jgi:hypothetical protein
VRGRRSGCGCLKLECAEELGVDLGCRGVVTAVVMIVCSATAIASVVAHLDVPCSDSGPVGEVIASCEKYQSGTLRESC